LITVNWRSVSIFCSLFPAFSAWTIDRRCMIKRDRALSIASLAGCWLMTRSYGGYELCPRGDKTEVVSLLLLTVILFGHQGRVHCKKLFWKGKVLLYEVPICKKLGLLFLSLMRGFEVSKLDLVRMEFRFSHWLLNLRKFVEIQRISHFRRALNLFSFLKCYGFFLLLFSVDLPFSCNNFGSDTVELASWSWKQTRVHSPFSIAHLASQA
jgi:hypothetical protein